MSICARCGGQIAWKRLESGKWCPTEPDGSSHFDICKARQRLTRAPERKPALFTGHNVKWVWNGEVPPWDESLGEFRRFTVDEMCEAVICRRV